MPPDDPPNDDPPKTWNRFISKPRCWSSVIGSVDKVRAWRQSLTPSQRQQLAKDFREYRRASWDWARNEASKFALWQPPVYWTLLGSVDEKRARRQSLTPSQRQELAKRIRERRREVRAGTSDYERSVQEWWSNKIREFIKETNEGSFTPSELQRRTEILSGMRRMQWLGTTPRVPSPVVRVVSNSESKTLSNRKKMSLDEFRQEMYKYWQRLYEHGKTRFSPLNPSLPFYALKELFSRLDADQRRVANEVLGEWVLSDNTDRRHDALRLISELKVTTALPAVEELIRRTDPSSAQSLHNFRGLAAKLTEHQRQSGAS